MFKEQPKPQLKVSKEFKAVLDTGARQVGKGFPLIENVSVVPVGYI